MTPGTEPSSARSPPQRAREFRYRFELLPLAALRAHEAVDPENLLQVLGKIRRQHLVDEPILVAEAAGGLFVVLNGHHRFAALRELGVQRAPAWVVDYEGEAVILERWPGARVQTPPTKAEVVERALSGDLFPPKTTRHRLTSPLPTRVTHLADLR